MQDKILLYKKNGFGLFLFEHDDRVEFVVGYLDDDETRVGEHVETWHSGTYYRDLESALSDIKSR